MPRRAPALGRLRSVTPRGARLLAALAGALAATAAPAQVEYPAPPESADEAAPPAPARPPPRAAGRLVFALGVAAGDPGVGASFTAGAGFSASERLRLELLLSAIPQRGTFTAPPPGSFGAPVTGTEVQVARGSALVAASWRGGWVEPWVGAGWAVARTTATVYGPDVCFVFCGRSILAEDSGGGTGPIAAAGVRLAVWKGTLIGVEVHKPLIRAANLNVPLRVDLGAPYVVAGVTFRTWAPPDAARPAPARPAAPTPAAAPSPPPTHPAPEADAPASSPMLAPAVPPADPVPR